MEINFDKFKSSRIKEDLAGLYREKFSCSDEIARYCYDSTGNALRIIQIDARIEAVRNVLRVLGINAYYENEQVRMVNNTTGEEI